VARASAGYRTTGAGSATLPTASLYSLGTGDIWLVEVGVTNTTVTAFECSLKRFSTGAGTPGTAQTCVYEEGVLNFTAKGDPRDTHTVTPTTIVAGELRRGSIGASIGSGVIWTFGGRGLLIPSGTTNGVGVMPMTGTGQIIDVYWSYDQ
jgi:hypothetical protein